MRAAAAIALLLVGWWSVRSLNESPELPKQQPGREMVAQQPESAASVEVKTAPTEQTIAANPLPKRAKESNPLVAVTTSKRSGKVDYQVLSETSDVAFRQRPMLTTDVYFPPIVSQRERLISVADLPVDETDAPLSTGNVAEASTNTFAVDFLKSRPFAASELASIHRIVWFRPAEPDQQPAESKQQPEKRERWASVSLMPGAFNPSVAVQVPTFANTSSFVNNQAASTQSLATVQSQANFSVAYQAVAGLQLTERWSVESGVGYLAGRSTVESPTQGYIAQGALSGLGVGTANRNLYADALQNSSGRAVMADAVNSLGSYYQAKLQNAYDPLNRQTLRNDFQYVQVPVQVGYQLRPRKRLGLALLGGFLTNIFVRNTVADELVIEPQDGVYRPVSWAASLGARFRYRPTRRWSASLAGLYQPTLGAGTRPESQVQSRPTTAGVSFGVDYHF